MHIFNAFGLEVLHVSYSLLSLLKICTNNADWHQIIQPNYTN